VPYVTFQPGARTAWHLHPAGQHMIVTKGVALTGTRDGTILRFEGGGDGLVPRPGSTTGTAPRPTTP